MLSTESDEQNVALRLVVFDVGHGDSILVEVVSHNPPVLMLIDGGSETGSQAVLDYLRETEHRSEIRHLDFVVATHCHQDHVEGLHRIIAVEKQIDSARELWMSKSYAEKSARQVSDWLDWAYAQHTTPEDSSEDTSPEAAMKGRDACRKLVDYFDNNRWKVNYKGPEDDPVRLGDDTEVEFLAPGDEVREQLRVFASQLDRTSPPSTEMMSQLEEVYNNQSLVIRIKHRGVGLLMTADAQKKSVEEMLRKQNDKLSSNCILKVPHHGSASSMTGRGEECGQIELQVIDPHFAIFSTGEKRGQNQPPHKETFDAYYTFFQSRSRPRRIYCTEQVEGRCASDRTTPCAHQVLFEILRDGTVRAPNPVCRLWREALQASWPLR